MITGIKKTMGITLKSLILLGVLLPVAHAGQSRAWGYEGSMGPTNWGGLASSYGLCATGKQQSPINITQKGTKASENEIDFHYTTDTFSRVLDGHDFSVEVLPGSNEYIIFNGDKYKLQGLHFHAPAEHQIDRITYPLEVHFIHTNSQGKLLVVGVFFKEGKENKNLQKLFAGPLPPLDKSHTNMQNKVVFDPAQLIPKDSGYYIYSGSLTTPPCTEGVTWLVMKKILNASTEQLDFFRHQIIDHNARPVQPLNQRTIYEYED